MRPVKLYAEEEAGHVRVAFVGEETDWEGPLPFVREIYQAALKEG